MATIAAPDVEEIDAWYSGWLGYKVRETGKVSDAMAASWGAPMSAGRPYSLMSSDAAPDVFIRAVESSAVAGYQPATTWGWNAFEVIIDDIDAVYEKLKKSPFTIIGEPHPLKSVPTIRAMQVTGPGSEILYLTAETGDRGKSRLPPPGRQIGRLFIVVVGGPDIVKLRDWYADTFTMKKNRIRESTGQVVQQAWGLPDGSHPITLLRLREHGNSMELNGYPAGTGPRPRPEGGLPPGNAMATFSVENLDHLEVEFLTPPTRLAGAAYQGRLAATVVGPAGELTELIEEPTV